MENVDTLVSRFRSCNARALDAFTFGCLCASVVPGITGNRQESANVNGNSFRPFVQNERAYCVVPIRQIIPEYHISNIHVCTCNIKKEKREDKFAEMNLSGDSRTNIGVHALPPAT